MARRRASEDGNEIRSQRQDGTGVASGQPIDLLTQLPPGSHSFSIDNVDNIGNRGTISVVFTIAVTADSIKQDVNLFLSAGHCRGCHGKPTSNGHEVRGSWNQFAPSIDQTVARVPMN